MDYEFGPFRLNASLGLLMRGNAALGVGQRAVSVLKVLIEHAGQPVSKDELTDAAWGGLAVEESNLTVQISALRKALSRTDGHDWIETLPRRGYRYIGPPARMASSGNVAATITPSPLTIPEMPSIAVLPFSNLSGEDNDYFADGMVDDIITGLSRIRWLFVIARSSTSKYSSDKVDVREVGRALGARYVLEGSVRRLSDQVRITCQLVDASTGMHVWADRYDRVSKDIFDLQDDIALSVVGAIAPSLRRAEADRVVRIRPESPDAYDLVLRAQRDVDSGMPEQVARALLLLERAIELEPNYALAYGNAAMCHHCLFLRAGLKAENRKASVDHARLAIVHGRDDALALTFAGFSIGMDGHDRGTAFATMDSALAISPSSALTYILGSVLHAWAGNAEQAIAWSEKGLRLSPFDSWTFAAYDARALAYFTLGRFEEASQAAYKSIQANPAHSITYVQLAAALAKLGCLPEATAAARQVLQLQPAFRYSLQFAGVNCAPELATSLGEALSAAGLPE